MKHCILALVAAIALPAHAQGTCAPADLNGTGTRATAYYGVNARTDQVAVCVQR